MNKNIIEFLEQEYDYLPEKDGMYTLTEHQLESLLIHMAEDATGRMSSFVFEDLEALVDYGDLSTSLGNGQEYVMNHYHGIDE